MFKFIFIKNDAKNMLSLTIFFFFQVCYASAPPRDAAIVYVTVNDLALNNIPIFFEILFSMHFICFPIGLPI